MEQDFDLSLTRFDLKEIDELLAAVEPEQAGLTEDDEVPEAPEQPVTRAGDLWILGGHRLLCGDATVLADVERVLGGQLADMTWRDLPYGLNYADTPKDKLRKNDLHPTMKPVALVERAIRNSSKSRDIVLDPFGGSGSTLIGCEKAGRRRG
jgi:DNA modification methylase